MKWFLDAGHGGADSGAVGQGSTKESDINLAIAMKVGNILSQYDEKVQYSRNLNRAVSLIDRCKLANSYNADVFVSIHCNSADNKEAYGVESWVYKNNPDAKSYKISKTLCEKLASVNNTRNRGVKVNPKFTVLAQTKMPSIILEVDFISNRSIETKMKTDKYINDTAVTIASCLLEVAGKKLQNNVCITCGK